MSARVPEWLDRAESDLTDLLAGDARPEVRRGLAALLVAVTEARMAFELAPDEPEAAAPLPGWRRLERLRAELQDGPPDLGRAHAEEALAALERGDELSALRAAVRAWTCHPCWESVALVLVEGEDSDA